MARLPEPVLAGIDAVENYQYVEEGKKKHCSLLADLLHELATKEKECN